MNQSKVSPKKVDKYEFVASKDVLNIICHLTVLLFSVTLETSTQSQSCVKVRVCIPMTTRSSNTRETTREESSMARVSCSWEMDRGMRVSSRMVKSLERERRHRLMEPFTRETFNREKRMAMEKSCTRKLMSGTRESGAAMWDRDKELYLLRKRIPLQ